MVLIDGVRGVLTGAGMEDQTVEQILSMLTEAQQTVKQGERIELAPAGSYGDAPTAAELGLHAGKAHHHVIDAMTQMVEGLRTYQKNVEHLREDAHEVDGNNASGLLRIGQRLPAVTPPPVPSIEAGTACVAPSTFAANTSCEMPEGDR